MRLLYVATLAAFALLILVQFLSNAGYFGPNNAEVSAMFPTPITPSGWAFSIWGIIFSGELLATLYAFMPSRTENSMFWKTKAATGTFAWWMLGWLCECLWQVFFSKASPSGMRFAAIFIVGALCAFQKALQNLHALQHSNLPGLPSTVYAAFWVPTALNAAWLSVASAVQLVITAQINTDLSPLLCAVALALVVLTYGIWVTYSSKDMPYGLALVWSFVAIFGARSASQVTVRVLCIVALGLLLPVTLSTVLRKRGHRAVSSAGPSTPRNVPVNPESAALLSS